VQRGEKLGARKNPNAHRGRHTSLQEIHALPASLYTPCIAHIHARQHNGLSKHSQPHHRRGRSRIFDLSNVRRRYTIPHPHKELLPATRSNRSQPSQTSQPRPLPSHPPTPPQPEPSTRANQFPTASPQQASSANPTTLPHGLSRNGTASGNA